MIFQVYYDDPPCKTEDGRFAVFNTEEEAWDWAMQDHADADQDGHYWDSYTVESKI